MDLGEILSRIDAEPTSVWEGFLGENYHFDFNGRQHFNVNGVIIRCDELYVSRTGLEFYLSEHPGGRFVQIDRLNDIENFYHYFG